MNPIALNLPVRPPEAGLLAEVIFDQAAGKRLTPDIRQRIATRAAALKVPGLIPYFGSLQADPIHPAAFFLAVDGTAMEGESKPLLLRFAPSSSPASGLFGESMLIGRLRLADRSEVVVNAIPFGQSDAESIDTFVNHVDRAFSPRPQGATPAILAPAADAQTAFSAFRQILKARGVNLAAFHGSAEAAIWAAIRSGWRDGFSVFCETLILKPGTLQNVEQKIPESIEATGFVIDPSAIPAAERPAGTIAALDLLARARSGRARLKHFDFALSTYGQTPLAEFSNLLQALRDAGRAPQSVTPLEGPDAEASIAAIRQAGASVRVDAAAPDDVFRHVVRASSGRIQCATADAATVLDVADRLRSA